jgi:LacI family transcriptional regulator
MWVKVGDNVYYDDCNGILRSNTNMHKVELPMEVLDAAKEYTVVYRKMIERAPYFPTSEDERVITEAEYSRLLASLGKPIAFIDACVGFTDLGLNANLLLMDSRNSCRQMLTTLVQNHKLTSMGFVGDANHCISFRERYEAFLMVGKECGVDTSYRLLDNDLYYAEADWLSRRLPEMGPLPQLIFCADDFLASQIMYVLDSMGKRVPEDVMICGFDGIYSAPPTLSRLTTISTPAHQLGSLAATTLLHKLAFPSEINSSTYLHTRIIYRASAPEI